MKLDGVFAAVQELYKARKPRLFLDAAEVPDPPEWKYAPAARRTVPQVSEGDRLIVREGELYDAIVQHVLLIYCGRCKQRHAKPRAGYEGRSPFYRCPRCETMNEMPDLAP